MVERSRILPSLPESEIEIGNSGSSDFQLYIVPRGLAAVPPVELDGLVVSPVARVIPATVTEVDSPDECDITLGRGRVANDDELLVVRTASPHSFIEQHFAACFRHLHGESSVLFCTEREPVTVRAPKEATHVGATSAQVCYECRDRWSVICYTLVSVSSPVCEAHLVIGAKSCDDRCQTSEIRGAIHQECDMVALGPCDAPGPTRVDLRHGVASFFRE
jgi:hypothetical protein